MDVVTLAVADLERALAFYRDGLGLELSRGWSAASTWTTRRMLPARSPCSRWLANDSGLYPRSELAKDAAVSPGPAQSGEFSLGHLVASRAAVDALLGRAEAAGAVVTAPHDRPWGIYSGYFRDLDEH